MAGLAPVCDNRISMVGSDIVIFGGEQNEDAEPLSRGERVAMWIVLAVLAFTLLAIGGIIGELYR